MYTVTNFDIPKSKGHILFCVSEYGVGFEFYKDSKGDLWSAQTSNVIDLDTEHRHGHWEAPAHLADTALHLSVQM